MEIVERAVRVAEHIKAGTPIDSLQSNSMVGTCFAAINLKSHEPKIILRNNYSGTHIRSQVSKSKVLTLLTELLSTFSLENTEATSEFVKAASALLNNPDPEGLGLNTATNTL